MDDEIQEKPEDDETSRLMEEHDIDEEMAEKVQELVDEGLDEDDAVELADRYNGDCANIPLCFIIRSNHGTDHQTADYR